MFVFLLQGNLAIPFTFTRLVGERKIERKERCFYAKKSLKCLNFSIFLFKLCLGSKKEKIKSHISWWIFQKFWCILIRNNFIPSLKLFWISFKSFPVWKRAVIFIFFVFCKVLNFLMRTFWFSLSSTVTVASRTTHYSLSLWSMDTHTHLQLCLHFLPFPSGMLMLLSCSSFTTSLEVLGENWNWGNWKETWIFTFFKNCGPHPFHSSSTSVALLS